MSTDPIEITRGGAELLDAVRPLWLALRDHHHQVAPELGPVRADHDTWTRRRGQYAAWLEDERTFVLLARRHERAVGYAFARVADSMSATWDGGTILDVETLSILPEARGSGIGSRLLARLREEVAVRGYDQLTLTAVAANRDALRFYEREGFAPTFVHLRDTRRTR
jgi:GNAT superfamily N-acetyltransferase